AALYRDFVALEREAMTSAESRRYWRDVLEAADFEQLPRGAASVADPQRVLRVDMPIEHGVAAGLKKLAQAAGAPIKSVLLAAHMKVLSHVTGSAAPVTGLLANGRPEVRDGEKIVGPFVNLVPLRV